MTRHDLTAADWLVGAPVWIRSVNNRRGAPDQEGVVDKVGRKLVTVRFGPYDTVAQFRIANGVANDRWGYEWIETAPMRQARLAREADLAVLREHGFTLSTSGCPSEAMIAAVAAAIRALTNEASDRDIGARHLEHYRWCGCLGNSSECCGPTCSCKTGMP